MSVAEVEAILGTDETVRNSTTNVNNDSRVPAEQRDWRNGQRAIRVFFINGKEVNAVGVNL